MAELLINYGTSEQAVTVYEGVKQYAKSIGISQKQLYIMALYDFLLEHRELELSDKIARYTQG